MTTQEELVQIFLDNHKDKNEWLSWHQLCKFYDPGHDGRTTDRQREDFKKIKGAWRGAKKRLEFRGLVLIAYREMNTRGNYRDITALRIYEKGNGDEAWLAAELQLRLNMAKSFEKGYQNALTGISDLTGLDVGTLNNAFKALKEK